MIASLLLLDANIFMYAAGAPHRYREPCLLILADLEQGALPAAIDTEFIQEMLYRYSRIGLAEKGLRLAREMLTYPLTILPVTEADARLAIDLFDVHRAAGIMPRDAIHAAIIKHHGITHVISADADFDHFAFLTRIDPQNYATTP